jgi:hypothetical protein
MTLWLRWELAGGELYRWAIEDDRLYRVHVSLGEAALMERNKRVKNGEVRKMDWARPFSSMSKAQRGVLEKKFPGLRSGDGKEREKTWERLSRDPDYKNLFTGRY